MGTTEITAPDHKWAVCDGYNQPAEICPVRLDPNSQVAGGTTTEPMLLLQDRKDKTVVGETTGLPEIMTDNSKGTYQSHIYRSEDRRKSQDHSYHQ